MVDFNILKITPDGKTLIIDASISGYYKYGYKVIDTVSNSTVEPVLESDKCCKDYLSFRGSDDLASYNSPVQYADTLSLDNISLYPKTPTPMKEVKTVRETLTLNDSPIYKNVYIDSIIIDTQDTYTPAGPSSTPIYKKEIQEDTKTIHLELGKGDFLPVTNDTIFYVYIKTRGNISAPVPCGKDKVTTLGVTLDYNKVHKEAFKYLNTINNKCNSDCNIPKHLIDSILKVQALEVSIKTENYVRANYYWNKFFRVHPPTLNTGKRGGEEGEVMSMNTNYKKCNCNG